LPIQSSTKSAPISKADRQHIVVTVATVVEAITVAAGTDLKELPFRTSSTAVSSSRLAL
jgi:hypothetical protein